MAAPLITKVCAKCKKNYNTGKFLPSRSILSEDGFSPFCASCATTVVKVLAEEKGEWNAVSKLCQLLDFPFIPTVWFQFEGKPIEQALNPYFSFFTTKEEFDSLDWKTYNDAFTALREKGTLEEEIPILSEKKKRE